LTTRIKKCKIIFSHYHLYKFLPIIGGVNAFLFGLFMQPIGLKLFKNYWFLPTKLISFNYMIMLLCTCFPFILFSFTFFFNIKNVEFKIDFLLNKQSSFKGNLFSWSPKISFAHFGIMTRYIISLAFSSF